MHPQYDGAVQNAIALALLAAFVLLAFLPRRLAAPCPAAAIVRRTALFAALWLVLTGGVAGSWGIGLAAIALATVLSMRLVKLSSSGFGIAAAARFLAFFVWQAIRSGAQVAIMALRPRMDLRPAIIDLELRLRDEHARLFLASTLNLLPGTLSCALEGQRLTLHVLDARRFTEPEVRAAEARVAGLYPEST